jgi:excisionase family DNA binding protein
MNVMTDVHPYLDGKAKRILIDGKWLEAASGKTFETRNPATGEVLANVAEGDAEDIERAVAAARAAFNGPWSKFKPAARQHLLLKLADLVERDIEEFAALDTLDMGAPISRTRNNRQRVLGMLRFYAGMATALHGETIGNSLPGEYVPFTPKEPVGVVGAIIPWNGPLNASIWKIGPVLATGSFPPRRSTRSSQAEARSSWSNQYAPIWARFRRPHSVHQRWRSMNSSKSQKTRPPMQRMLSVADVAERLQLCARTIRRAIANGELHVHQIGRQYRVAEDDLTLFVATRRK